MQNFFFPQEEDFKKWIKESISEELSKLATGKDPEPLHEERLVTRAEMARVLDISLVTLTDWMKKGLPYLRLNGRVYFRRSEVMAAMSTK